MAGELQTDWTTGTTVYFQVRNSVGQIWNTSGTPAFENYVTANIANYAITATEQGSASGFFVGTMPATITAGIYSIEAKQRIGVSVAESDPTVGTGNISWSGTVSIGLNAVQLAADQVPMKKNTALSGFQFLMVSSSDNVTPATGLTVTGTVSLDGAAFSALTNSVSEIGSGWYKVNLAAADTNGNTVALKFAATGAATTNIGPFLTQ